MYTQRLPGPAPRALLVIPLVGGFLIDVTNSVVITTLVNLLPRLQNPPRGTVFIDGRDVRDIPLSELRGLIGFVPQEPFLFSTTIEKNVEFGVDKMIRYGHRVRHASWSSDEARWTIETLARGQCDGLTAAGAPARCPGC
mgnify:CR=1 FL=1